jgi:hypothetical protein
VEEPLVVAIERIFEVALVGGYAHLDMKWEKVWRALVREHRRDTLITRGMPHALCCVIL